MPGEYFTTRQLTCSTTPAPPPYAAMPFPPAPPPYSELSSSPTPPPAPRSASTCSCHHPAARNRAAPFHPPPPARPSGAPRYPASVIIAAPSPQSCHVVLRLEGLKNVQNWLSSNISSKFWIDVHNWLVEQNIIYRAELVKIEPFCWLW